jgi:gag-polypeptide of LTR copia-type
MGPADISDMSSTTNKETLNLPKLRSDSSNWATYHERIINYLASKGLKKHILGTARQPIKLEERGGDYYKPHSLAPLTDEELEKHEEEEEAYEQKQAAVREVIYRTVDKSTFLQVKNEITAAAIWKKVTSIHADKGSMYETNLLMQLQTI